MDRFTYKYLVSARLFTRTRLMFFMIVLSVILFSWSTTWSKSIFEILDKFFIPPVTVPCNTDAPVPLTNLNYSDLAVTSNTSGLCILGCGIQNASQLVDADESNFATVVTTVGLGVTHNLRVTDNTADEFYTAGNYAGFLIRNTSLVQADLLNAIVVRTYLDGVQQENSTGASLVVLNTSLLGTDQYYVGFYTTEDFDAIQISISSLAGVLSTTYVYHAVTNSFCVGPDLECNTPTPLAKPEFPARIVEEHTGFGGLLGVGSITDVDNTIDSNSNSYASIDFILGALATGNLAIKDELTDYESNTYVGFDIENSSVVDLDLIGAITIRTYLDGVLQEARTGPSELVSVDSGLLLTGTERSQLGFLTTLPFDEVQLSIQQTVGLNLGSTRVYGLVLQAFCEGELDCSMTTILNNPSQPVIINNTRTGIDGVACVGCEVDNATNVISESLSDFAMINVVAGVVGTASISVENILSTFPSGSDAGFVIRDTNDLLQVDLLNSLTVTTYLNGSVQETQTAGNLLALEALGLINITPTSSDGFYLVGFTTSEAYDEVRLTVAGVVGVINSIEVYGSYVDASIQIEGTVVNETAIGASDGNLSVTVTGGTPPYEYLWSPGGETSSSISGLSPGLYTVTVTDANGCEATAEFIIYTDGVQYPVPCNTDEPVAVTEVGFTDLDIAANTSGVCVLGCGILNEDNIIDANEDNFATVATLVGLGVTHTLRVTDDTDGEVFNGGGYAGFLIRNSSVVQADLLDAIVVRTRLDGVQQEVSGSGSLVAINSTLLGADQYYVGLYTTMDYDAIEISISSLAGVLSTTDVFHAVTNSFCVGPALECNVPTQLTKPEFPVRIVDDHTGLGGILGVGNVDNTNNIIDNNPGNYASITLLAGVIASGSVAVKDEITDYPENTYAGFDIENASLLNTQLFDAITITTYLDGTFVESRTGTTELLPVSTGLLFPGNESVRIGFVTTAPFDEVRITVSQALSVNLGSTLIYGMVLQAFCEGTISCDEPFVLANPSYPVIINNGRTGIDGVACVACEVDDTQNVISVDNSDFAMINVVAGVASTASISVKDVLEEYPTGTVAGFVIRDTNDLLEVDLLNSITITTYLDNVQREQRTAANLLALEALGLINITPTSSDNFYVVAFDTSLTFDEVRITVGAVAGVINSLEVYGAYIDATGTSLCQTADIAIVKTGTLDLGSDGIANAGDTIDYTFTVTNTGNVELTDITVTDPLVAVTGGPLATLAVGATDSTAFTASYTITQADVDAGSFTNQATATGTTPGGEQVTDLSDDTSNFEDDPTVTEIESASIAVIKTGTLDLGSDGIANAGDTIDYTFTVTNTGNVELTDITVTDPLVAVTGGPLATLAVGATDSTAFTASYTITQADVDAGSFTNQATATGTTPGGEQVTDLSDDTSNFEDDPTVTEIESASIAVIKTGTLDLGSDGIANAGDTIDYTFTVTNTGNVELTDIIVTDPLVAVTGGPLATLAVGATNSTTFTASYTITQADVDAGSFTNQATATGTTPGGEQVTDLSDDTSNFEDDPTVTEIESASIAIIKTGTLDLGSDGIANAGDTIDYTFTVTNTGNVELTDITVTDPLVAVTGGPLATLAVGATDSTTFTASYTITQADVDAGSFTNQATATGTTPGGEQVTDLSDDTSNFEDDPTVTEIESASIAIIKTGTLDLGSDGIANAGDTIDYTFTVTNTGNVELTDITVTDPLVAVTGGPLATLAVGATDSTTFTASYTITQADVDAGSFTNQATATGTTPGGEQVTDLSDDTSNFEDDPTITEIESILIALIKTGTFNDGDGDGCSDVGETVTYAFTVTNEGNMPIANVVLNDPLLGGDIALASGDTDADGELDVDETWTYTMDYAITQSDIDAGTVSNQATVTGTGNGTTVTDLSDDDSILEDDVTDTTLCQPNETVAIAVIKTGTFNDSDGDNCSDVGETVTYMFTVTNEGNTAIANVVLNDPLLGGDIALASGDMDADGELDVDETWIYAMDYSITQSDIDSGMVSNQATVTGTGNGATVMDLSDDDSILEDDVTDTTLCQPNETVSIALIKTGTFNDSDGDGCSDVGETVTYAFTVTNEGNTPIASVVLNDPMLGGDIALASGDTDADGELDVDEIWIYSSDYTITQDDIDAGTVSNQATVSGTGNGTTVTDLSDDDSILEDDVTDTTLCQPNETVSIALIKTGTFNDSDGDGCSDVGETVTYAFTVTNEGNTPIASVVLNDPMLGGDIALASGDTDADGELDVDEIWIYSSDYTITQDDIDAGTVSNQATVTGTGNGTTVTDLSDDDSILEDDVTDTTLCQPNETVAIAVIKTGTFNDSDGDNCSDVGETVTYMFTVTNEGNTAIANVVLNDPLLGGDIALASGDMDADGELDVDETWIYAMDYSITQSDIDSGMVSNQASVTATGNGTTVTDLSDDNSILEDDTTVTALCNSGSISLEKIGIFNDDNGDGSTQVGETVSYAFIIYNTGSVTLYDITLVDDFIGVNLQGGPIAELPPGDTDGVTFTANYTITEQDMDAMSVTNQAIVNAVDVSGNPVTDTSDDPYDLTNEDINDDGEPDDPTVTILPEVLGEEFEIFNALSPDGDGLNDFFRIVGIENYPNNNLKIFNRWGVLIYDVDGYGINGKVFRGVSDGRVTVSKKDELPTGSYFYVLSRFVNGRETLTDEGYLYIKRN